VLTYPLGVAFYASERSYVLYDNYDFLISTHLSAVDSYTAFQTTFAQNRYGEIHRLRLGIGGPELRSSQRYDFDMEWAE
jgi:hypothetical protein